MLAYLIDFVSVIRLRSSESKMYKKTAFVKNKAGIHCRPSSTILLEAQKFPDCHFKIYSDKGSSELGSMLSLLALGLSCGDKIEISAEGKNEAEAVERLYELFEFEFDFPT